LAELDAFSSSVAHDLRAPLRSIQGFAEMVVEDHGPAVAGEPRALLERVISNAAHMGALIESLLRIARVSQGTLRREEVDLSRLVRDEAERLATAEPHRQVELIVDEGVRVQADGTLARTLLQNLVGNAWKFTSRTSAPRIEFGATGSPHERTLFVRDNGAGFEAAQATKLFAPFRRLHSASDFPGTGIGLATSQRIVNRHGGRIWAQGSAGQGATFYFTLPDPLGPEPFPAGDG
jgi:signal transduction histidine kinase